MMSYQTYQISKSKRVLYSWDRGRGEIQEWDLEKQQEIYQNLKLKVYQFRYNELQQLNR